MLSYRVVVPAHLSPAYQRLPKEMRLGVGMHLLCLAEAAAAVHEIGEGETPWSNLAGLDAGDHRQLFGELWLSYFVAPLDGELELLDFGDASLTSRVAPLPPLRAPRRHDRPRGGGSPASTVARSRDLHAVEGGSHVR
ncbi:hypothetical protein FGE12_23880 [Aggregicoccus sp. 17bor-14]|uniref:hypothetical protein n=1 Tax=Myxococcaceae TaxID=31 RepID=UPI00129D0D79|nr:MULTISPECIES: hypothetical protein [Myxococcaceae]MBF5045468.1 hypothetical protein [Simulacricoccus sp. 17bor-14]MRI91206.1 hypothetical protein [Aggregicoccus sp. 17bor-14]